VDRKIVETGELPVWRRWRWCESSLKRRHFFADQYEADESNEMRAREKNQEIDANSWIQAVNIDSSLHESRQFLPSSFFFFVFSVNMSTLRASLIDMQETCTYDHCRLTTLSTCARRLIVNGLHTHRLNEISDAVSSQEIQSLKKTSNDISEIEKNVEDLMHRIVLPSITSIHLSMSDNQNARSGEGEREKESSK
jgi:hypothetical protein